MICPNCKTNISETFATSDSDMSGFLDISFECKDCDITIYTLKIEKGIAK